MLKIAAGTLVVAVLLALSPEAAYAQPATCAPGRINTEDMVGVYIDPASPMRVQIYPCGGATVLWDNAYGRHLASYTMTTRVPGEGLIGHGYKPDPQVGYLDNAYTLGLKAGTPGTIEVFTVSPYGEFIAMYRLKKV